MRFSPTSRRAVVRSVVRRVALSTAFRRFMAFAITVYAFAQCGCNVGVPASAGTVCRRAVAGFTRLKSQPAILASERTARHARFRTGAAGRKSPVANSADMAVRRHGEIFAVVAEMATNTKCKQIVDVIRSAGFRKRYDVVNDKRGLHKANGATKTVAFKRFDACVFPVGPVVDSLFLFHSGIVRHVWSIVKGNVR